MLWLATCLPVVGQIQKVEPLHWWVGMKNPSLQIMVYGENLQNLTPEINYPGVILERFLPGLNGRYFFIYLQISPNTSPGTFQIQWKNKGKTQYQTPYTLEKREENSANRKGFGQEDMIYLITPDRFANGDLSNDQVTGFPDGLQRNTLDGRHGGDLAGVLKHLDYIESLGATTIWLNPVLENNQPSGSYHGYAITDFYQVDPRFGTNALYKTLVQEAKKRGIKVIIDGVLNHIGHQHPWMKNLPFEDWIHDVNQPKMTSHRRETVQDPYAQPSDIELHANGWFVPSMPDLNQRNPHLATYLIQQSIWWVEFAGLQGIRMDTYPYSDRSFLANWSQALMREYPAFTMVGEEWTDNPALVSFWQKGKKNANGYESYMPSMMDFPLQTALIKSLLKQKNPWDPAWITSYSALANDFLYPSPEQLVIFADNHDMSRVFTQVKENTTAWKQAMVYLATMRGIPQIYYATEFLGANPSSDAHGEIRLDMPGGWPGDSKNIFQGIQMTSQEQAALQFFKKVFTYRKNNPSITQGKLRHLAPRDGWYAYSREGISKTWLTLLYQGQESKRISIQSLQELLGKRSVKSILIQENARMEGDHLIFEGDGVLWLECE